eukprot:108096-Pleurochrysis_carterae.AAC.1
MRAHMLSCRTLPDAHVRTKGTLVHSYNHDNVYILADPYVFNLTHTYNYDQHTRPQTIPRISGPANRPYLESDQSLNFCERLSLYKVAMFSFIWLVSIPTNRQANASTPLHAPI